MKTLSSKEEPLFISKDSVVQKSRENYYRFQEFYDYLNQIKKKDKQVLVSIILPAYNEEKTIKNLLENLPNDKSIEIIVIDDNSTDNSVKEIQKVNNDKEIILLKHKENKGYGGAVITGFDHAKGDIIVTMDSDGQHCPEDIITLVKPIFEGEADCTIGSRYLGSNHYNLPIKTRLGEAIIEISIQILFGQKIMNNQNGFRAFNKNLISTFKKAKFSGFAYATEMIILALVDGFKIKECPIKVYKREHGSSHINLIKLTLNLLTCFFKYYLAKFLVFSPKRKRK